MLSLYSYPEALRVGFSVFAILCAATEAFAFVLHQYRARRNLLFWKRSILAFLMICQAVVCTALVAGVQHNMLEGFIVPSGYILPRYAVFAAIAAASVYPMIQVGTPSLVFAPAASFLTLPAIETHAGGASRYSSRLRCLLCFVTA